MFHLTASIFPPYSLATVNYHPYSRLSSKVCSLASDQVGTFLGGCQLKAHLALVPGLSLSPTPLSDLLILGFDFSDDAVQVQVTVVVHGQDHGSV